MFHMHPPTRDHQQYASIIVYGGVRQQFPGDKNKNPTQTVNPDTDRMDN